jgi:pimeloyl-ACP methyl ester carboxylesterase
VQTRTRYAKSGEVHIAYQVTGTGPLDLVFVPGGFTHIEYLLEEPSFARFCQRLASFSRLIRFDKRGTGLSDRASGIPTLEQRMDDVRAVMDAVGSERAALLGVSEGGPMSMLFAATYPARTSALVLQGAFAKLVSDAEYPWGLEPEIFRGFADLVEYRWGEGDSLAMFAPSVEDDERFKRWWGRIERLGASPGAALTLAQMAAEIDVRNLLPAIRVPTLILHRTGDKFVQAGGARYMADRIPGAKLVELPGDHLPFVGDQDSILDEIEQFLTGVRHRPEPDRLLATVFFVDIVGSTEQAAELGDRRWRDLLEAFYRLVRAELERFRGHEANVAGDGFFATFDGPARAIRCAGAIRDAVKNLGIAVRAGLHTGECEVIGDGFGGIAVHIGARVAAKAGAGEVVVSSTVKDLVAGSGLRFADRGAHTLKGIPGEWRLFAVEP